jgi:hypothetical protein
LNHQGKLAFHFLLLLERQGCWLFVGGSENWSGEPAPWLLRFAAGLLPPKRAFYSHHLSTPLCSKRYEISMKSA